MDKMSVQNTSTNESPVQGDDYVAEIVFLPKKNSGSTKVTLDHASITSPYTKNSVLSKIESADVLLVQ
jgi:hypothetical protein